MIVSEKKWGEDKMFDTLYPDKIINSVYELDWELLSRKYAGVIFDVDNTLVPHGAPADETAIKLFQRIHLTPLPF